MPRNVRNFWLELYVDGKKARVATGPVPVSADGGFSLRVLQRHRGNVTLAGYLVGTADESGKLVLTWESGPRSYLTLLTDKIVLNETER